MQVKNCVVNKEHCPYCCGHDTIILGSFAALVRGDTHWCGCCHKTFNEGMPKQPQADDAVARGVDDQHEPPTRA